MGPALCDSAATQTEFWAQSCLVSAPPHLLQLRHSLLSAGAPHLRVAARGRGVRRQHGRQANAQVRPAPGAPSFKSEVKWLPDKAMRPSKLKGVLLLCCVSLQAPLQHNCRATMLSREASNPQGLLKAVWVVAGACQGEQQGQHPCQGLRERPQPNNVHNPHSSVLPRLGRADPSEQDALKHR